jgi:hypothetical protein
MHSFTTLTAVAAPLDLANVDTDKIIPARFLKTIKRSGLGQSLFADMRYDAAGSEKPEFVLNQEKISPCRNSYRRRELWLWLVPGARPLGIAGFWHSLHHRAQLRRYLPRQLFQK